jgi:uncharacterized protein YhfF
VSREAILEMLEAYRSTLPAGCPQLSAPWVAEGFGDGPELADRLSALVLTGVKTATCSSLWEWEASGDPLPRVGLLTVVLDGAGLPLGIIETIEVRILAFDRVDGDFAREEGEGDRTLAYWRRAHWEYFLRTLARLGRSPREDMPLVCERIRLVHPRR